MKALMLMAWMLATVLTAAPKTVSYLRVAESTPIYHGASTSSKIEATARKGQVYEVVDTKLINGFYKIEYGGHVSYIKGGSVVLMDAKGSPVPTPKPTQEPTSRPTVRPTPQADDDGEVEDEELVIQSDRCRLKRGASDDDADDGEGTRGQRLVLKDKKLYNGYYKAEHKGRTVYVKAEHCSRVKKGAKAPTPVPTRVPTAAPTVKVTQKPTPEPTAEATVGPTAKPTAEPTPEPAEAPTEKSTLIPTKVPTAEPTQIPTKVPTLAPTPTVVAGVVTPASARGRRRTTTQPRGGTTQTQRTSYSSSRVAGSSNLVSMGGQLASGVQLRRGERHLNGVEFMLPLGMGKHETLVQPPYKQTPQAHDQRPVEYAGFAGLGLALRLADPLRLHFDWVAHSHRTKAADLGIPAVKVNVPGVPSTTAFDESDAWYRMNAHQLSLGLKLSLPHHVVEPWINGTYGIWIWNAELSDLHREIIYGEHNGVAFGGTLGAGIDFHGSFAGGLGWTITPFVEWGAPQVNPEFKDIAGLGVDWKDSFGTPVAVPARAGIQFGLGF